MSSAFLQLGFCISHRPWEAVNNDILDFDGPWGHWNRDFFSETKFSKTETETLKDLAKVSKPKCQSLPRSSSVVTNQKFYLCVSICICISSRRPLYQEAPHPSQQLVAWWIAAQLQNIWNFEILDFEKYWILLGNILFLSPWKAMFPVNKNGPKKEQKNLWY